MKKLGLGIVALIVLLVAALLIAPSFVDWNAHKGEIAAEVRKMTGRELAIDGDISLALLPAPALSANKVRLANIEGGSVPAMVELESLKVRIALLPLLQGEVRVERIDLVRPVIVAEVLPDGRKNWEFAPPGTLGAPAPAARDAQRMDGMIGEVSLNQLTITDGTLVYRDGATGREERVEKLNAEAGAESLQGPFAASGSAEVRAIPVKFDFNLGRLVNGGATPANLSLSLPKAAASVKFGGAVSLHAERTSLRGRLKGQGDSLKALVAALSQGTALPAVLARPFSLDAEIAADPERVAASDVMVQLGDTSAEGKAEVKLGPPIDATIQLSASRVDLDTLLAAPPAAPAAPAAAPASPPAAATAPPPSQAAAAAPILPTGLSAAVELSVDAVVYRGQVVRQVLIGASLADGKLKLDQALALLPGGSDISLTGVVGPDAAQDLRFDGRLEAGSDNLRGILDWLGVDVSNVPAARLRKMSLTTRVAATPELATLSDLDLRFDLSRVTGGAAFAFRDRIGFGLGLALDKIDLDAYLPVSAAGGAQPGKAPAKGAQPAGAGQAGAQPGAPVSPFAAPAVLGDFDANLDLKVGNLLYQGVSAGDLHLDATLQQGAVTVRELRVGDFAGASARLTGAFASLTSAPTVAVSFETKVPSTTRLARALGTDAGALAALGALDLSGTLKGSAERIAFTGDLAALGGRFGADGRAQPLAAPPTFDVKLTGKHPDLANLIAVFAPGVKLGPSFGALDLSGTVAGTPQKIAVSALDGRVGPLAVSGGLSANLSGPAPAVGDMDLSVAVEHADLAALVHGVAPDVTLPPKTGIDLKARLRGGLDRLQVTGIAGTVGPTQVHGAIGMDRTGARPAFDIDLETGVLPLAAFAAPAAGSGGKANAGKQPSASAGAAKAGERWSRTPIDTAAFNRVDATVKLKSAALVHDALRLDNAVVDASLSDGVLDLHKLSGTAYDGAVQVTGKIDARKQIDAGLALTAVDLNMAKLLKDVAESDRVSGPLSVNASVTAAGASEAELISALAGNGDVSGTLNVKAKAEEQVGALVLGILGQKIKEIRGVTDATNVLLGAFAGTPAAVKGTFKIDKGVVATNDLRVDGRDATALTKGTADLPVWQLDTETNVFRAADPDTAYLTAILDGPIDKPNVKVGGQAFQRQPAPAQPAPAQPGAAPAQPAAPKAPKPEDILKQGLKGLLKGLKQ